MSAKQVYDKGALPAMVPENILIGSIRCLIDGEVPEEAIEASDLVNGVPFDCFLTPPIPLDPWQVMSDYQSCAIQLATAKIIQWLYVADTARIIDLLRGMLPVGYDFIHLPGTVLYPNVYIAKSAVATFVYVDGTSNFQQLAMSAAYLLLPPENFGVLSTSAFWYAASDTIRARIDFVLVNPTGPIFLGGHSYGGIAACILAARYRAANPNRPIRYLTYGMPKIGDDRLIALLRTCDGLSFVNTLDIVPTLPPTDTLLAALIIGIAAPVLGAWSTWRGAPNQNQMDGAGQLTPNVNPVLDYPTALFFATEVLATIPYPVVLDHPIEEYFKRILLRCPTPEWPLTAADYAKILAP